MKAFRSDPITIKTAKYVLFAVITTPLYTMHFFGRFALKALMALQKDPDVGKYVQILDFPEIESESSPEEEVE